VYIQFLLLLLFVGGFCFVWQCWILIQHLVLARQALSLKPSPTLSALHYFHKGPHVFYQISLSDHGPPTSASCVAGIRVIYHHTWLFCWDKVSLTFCPAWSQIMILLIFTSQVAGITSMSHCTQLLGIALNSTFWALNSIFLIVPSFQQNIAHICTWVIFSAYF
jgi:hypothetical protein